MMIKRLEIQGFKSFADKTDFHFSPRITAIVGPNGCGKTNVFECIMFALGERNPKKLRGERIQDIIFYGNTKRRRSGFADVSLYLENKDNEETEVKRRVYQDGNLENYIGGEQISTQKFFECLRELFSGDRGYAHFNYQDIEEILNYAPVKVRNLLHSAAEIDIYQKKKETLRRRLIRVESEKRRLEDIMFEKKNRLGQLEKEVARAQLYWKLKDKLESLESEKKSLTLFYLKRDLSRKETEKGEKERYLASLLKREQSLKEKLSENRKKIQKTLEGLNQKESFLKEKLEEEKKIVQEMARIEERLKNLSTEKENTENEKIELTEKLKLAEREFNEISGLPKTKYPTETKEEERKLEDIIDNLKEKIYETRTNLSNVEINKKIAEQRVEERKEEIQSLKNYIENLEKETKEKREKMNNLKNKYEKISREMEKEEESLNHLLKQEKESAINLEKIKGKIARLSAERKIPENLLTEFDFLSDKIIFDSDEKALLLLEDYFDAKVFDNPEQLHNVHKTLFDANGSAILKRKGVKKFPFLKTHDISYFVEDLLKESRWVSSLEEGLKKWEENPKFTYVTEEGYVIDHKGFITRLTGKKIKREKELQSAKEKKKEINAILREIHQKRENQEKKISEKKEEQDQIKSEIEKLLTPLHYQEGELNHRTNILKEKEREIEELYKEIKEFKFRENRWIKDLKEKEKDFEEIEKNYQNVREKREEAERNRELIAKQEYLSRIIKDAGDKLELIENKLRKNSHSTECLQKERKVWEKKSVDLEKIKEEFSREQDNLKKMYQEEQSKSEEIESKIDEISQERQKIREEFVALEVKIEDIKEKCKEFPEDLPAPSSQMSIKRIDEDIESIRFRLLSFQDVNLAAEREYRALSDELQEYERQLDDVEKSRDKIKTALKILEEDAIGRFFEVFELFKENLSEVAKVLLQGEIFIELEDPKDPLNSNIIVKAKPSGKKVRTLSLLSGGERSLVALSIIFTLYLTRPTPFCVLDEMDAALDDANTIRFISLIQKLSQDTQFLIITHNKRTMEHADALYGITMEEDGISKVLSLELKRK